MYLSSANRGVSFTKPGFYTTGLVILLGFFATGSGYNGLFLALGFGLSFLLISGLLSEKTIQATELERVSDAVVDAGTPFSVDFLVSNKSATWYVFSLESLITTELPKFKLLQTKVDSLIEARLLMLAPGQTAAVPGKCAGMKRGWYHDFFIIQRTLFPFGMLAKFKVGKISTSISVLPTIDTRFEELLTRELAQRLANQIDDQEFHSHRPLIPGAVPHTIDMKKNAGKPLENWVMKVFESPAAQFGFWLDPAWSEFLSATSENEFEKNLSRLRTATEILRRTDKDITMKLANGRFVFGYDACLNALVKTPRFELRQETVAQSEGLDPKPGYYVRLIVTSAGHRWEDEMAALH